MTMRQIPEILGHGGAHLNQSVLRPILVGLQDGLAALEARTASLSGLISASAVRQTVVAGAGTDTDIAVAGIETGHTLLGVVKLDFTLADGTPNTRTWDAADLLSEASITSDGNIQLSTTDTSGAVLLVTWLAG